MLIAKTRPLAIDRGAYWCYDSRQELLMQKILSRDKLHLATLHRAAEWQTGLHFLTEGTEAIQVGTWFYPAEKDLQNHCHRPLPRETLSTQEGVFVVEGSLEARIFDEARNPVENLILHKGDLLILLRGGHGYRILAPDTRVLEFKNGPYVSREADKELFP